MPVSLHLESGATTTGNVPFVTCDLDASSGRATIPARALAAARGRSFLLQTERKTPVRAGDFDVLTSLRTRVDARLGDSNDLTWVTLSVNR